MIDLDQLQYIRKAIVLLEEREQLIADIIAIKGIKELTALCQSLPLDRTIKLHNSELLEAISSLVVAYYRKETANLEKVINELGVSITKKEQTWEEFMEDLNA